MTAIVSNYQGNLCTYFVKESGRFGLLTTFATAAAHISGNYPLGGTALGVGYFLGSAVMQSLFEQIVENRHSTLAKTSSIALQLIAGVSVGAGLMALLGYSLTVGLGTFFAASLLIQHLIFSVVMSNTDTLCPER